MTVFVVGLDGASIENLAPAVEKYGLESLRRLFDGGEVRPMASIYPYVTAPAWTSLFSGVNPGVHGVFEMLEATDDGRVKPANMGRTDAPFLWDYLSWAGKRTLVMGVPFIYPAPEVNGAFVTGRFTPALSAYPPDLGKEVDLSGYFYRELGSDEMLEDRILRGARETARNQLEASRKRTSAAMRMLDTGKWDAAILVEDLPDEIFHLSFGDEEIMKEMFTHLDNLLGGVMARMGEDDVLFVVSDHGFGPVRKLFYVKEWLASQGYLAPQRSPVATALHAFGLDWDMLNHPGFGFSAFKILHDHFPWVMKTLRRAVFRAVLEGRGPAPARGGVTSFNFNEAYAWVRVDEASPQTTEAKVGKVIGQLNSLKAEGVLKNVFRTKELYRGPHASDAPGQVMIEVPDGWSIDARRLNWGETVGNPLATKKGSHRLNGVFARYGRGQGEGRSRVSILDVAPTALAALKVPVPPSMEGTPL